MVESDMGRIQESKEEIPRKEEEKWKK